MQQDPNAVPRLILVVSIVLVVLLSDDISTWWLLTTIPFVISINSRPPNNPMPFVN